MKYIISTLGCKVNQYETQAMETMLLEHGHEPAALGEIADAVIVNTARLHSSCGTSAMPVLFSGRTSRAEDARKFPLPSGAMNGA